MKIINKFLEDRILNKLEPNEVMTCPSSVFLLRDISFTTAIADVKKHVD